MSVAPCTERPVALIDLLDRLLQGGVVLTGDLVLSIADVDLVRIDLRAVIAPVAASALSQISEAPCPRPPAV
ncbi:MULTISPECIES: gas vesicle protein [Streptomyces]|uniref:Gas vesicle protein n=1 Tax=Streptomyces koelreuteriae TaxID=2838015 RepID=A0ABX8FMH2_9ACTN|nr:MULTISPECIES: gas vesicle protein [Streptomyces]QWB22319.1 gas vesicle protein [Streptomyces koelreuteriae]UUA05261.1 gas vesicle protein [Streptomyces koelreuteriae]UUA12887.1 gas vesicle protein [Streptomyces sp. CRCS-T-1]